MSKMDKLDKLDKDLDAISGGEGPVDVGDVAGILSKQIGVTLNAYNSLKDIDGLTPQRMAKFSQIFQSLSETSKSLKSAGQLTVEISNRLDELQSKISS